MESCLLVNRLILVDHHQGRPEANHDIDIARLSSAQPHRELDTGCCNLSYATPAMTCVTFLGEKLSLVPMRTAHGGLKAQTAPYVSATSTYGSGGEAEGQHRCQDTTPPHATAPRRAAPASQQLPAQPRSGHHIPHSHPHPSPSRRQHMRPHLDERYSHLLATFFPSSDGSDSGHMNPAAERVDSASLMMRRAESNSQAWLRWSRFGRTGRLRRAGSARGGLKVTPF